MNLKILVIKKIIKQFLLKFTNLKSKQTSFKTIQQLINYTNKIYKEILINEISGVNLNISDIYTLKNSNWLNDKIINAYFELLVLHFNFLENSDSYFTFSTYFFSSLSKEIDWFKNVDLFKYKKILIPIHKNSHWLMVCYDRIKNQLLYFDSLYEMDRSVYKPIVLFLESQFKNSVTIDVKCIDCDTQSNGNDCGVYACSFAKMCLLEKNNCIDSKLMRRVLVHELYIGKIIYDTELDSMYFLR